MKFSRIVLLIMITFVVSLSSCQRKPVAVVEGNEITEKELKWFISEQMNFHQKSGFKVKSVDLRPLALQRLISHKLMVQGAKENGISVSDQEVDIHINNAKERMGENKLHAALSKASLTETDYRKIVREKLLAAKFKGSLVPADSITEEEIQNYYKESPTPFLMPQTVNVRFIKSDTKEAAEALIARIEKEGFDNVADSVQESKEHKVIGYGWAAPETFSKEISDSIKKTPLGEYRGPIEGADGYYTFFVKEREGERIKTLEEASAEIKILLLDTKRAAAAAHWIANRKKIASIVTN